MGAEELSVARSGEGRCLTRQIAQSSPFATIRLVAFQGVGTRHYIVAIGRIRSIKIEDGPFAERVECADVER